MVKLRQNIVIKEAESWDGSASNYTNAETFAASSLLNFNIPAGRGSNPDDWTKTLIKLPVREEGDAENVFVDKAIFAAAGGRGITAVTRPEGVSQTEFDRMIRRAARTIVEVYDVMEMEAPESVVGLAGLSRNQTDRAVPMFSLLDRIQEHIWIMDMAEGTHSFLIDVYFADGELFAMLVRNGLLYKLELMIAGDDVYVGELEEVELPDMERSIGGQSSVKVTRQADGRYRFLCIASTSALNRVGEIDSRELFDSFIAYAQETEDYPILNFWHQGDESRLGKVDYLARDNHVFIASGLFDDNKYGRAAAKGLASDPNYWGNSIEFYPYAGEVMTVKERGAVVEIPVFTRGICTAVSILPEDKAAAWFTSHIPPQEEIMREDIKEDLDRLMQGEEETVEEFEALVDGVNRNVSGKIHRETEVEEATTEEAIEQEVEEVIEEVTAEAVEEVTEEVIDEVVEEVIDEVVEEVAAEYVLDDSVVGMIAGDLLADEVFLGGLATFVSQSVETAVSERDETISSLRAELDELRQRESEREGRLVKLEADEAAKRREWEDDLPAEKPKAVTYRPRQEVNGQVKTDNSLANKAAETLRTIYGK